MHSTKRSLNLIYAKHIKHLRINDKSFFKHIIKDKYFRSKTTLDDKKDILTIEINKILKNRYHNNKTNVIFQEFIDYLLSLLNNPLVHYNNTHLFIDLVKWVTNEYKVYREINPIHEIRQAGKYTMEKLKLVGELIDQIDYLNYLNNDITKVEKLRMLGNTSKKAYIEKFKNTLETFVNSDKDLIYLYEHLNTKTKTIKTKLLYNALVNLKEDLRQRMHNINYGIIENNDKIKELGDQFTTQVMPFMESGRVDLSDKQFRNLHINTIYFKKSDTRKINAFKNGYYNKAKIDGKINIIFDGINPFNKGKYSKSYMIQYQYITTEKQNKQYIKMLKSLKESMQRDSKYNSRPLENNKDFKTRNYEYPCYNKQQRVNSFKDYIECSYTYPYVNQRENFKAFNEYYKDITQITDKINYTFVYPNSNTSIRLKNQFFNTTSFNNNIWRDYLLRSKINRSLANILYRLDFERKITNFYNPKNQMYFTRRALRVFLAELIKDISKDSNLTKLFKEYLDELIKGYNERIYLFQIYGIDALKNQINNLQQYYNTNYKGKWDYRTRDINKLIRKLTKQIKQRKIYLDYIIMQKFTVNKFKDNFKGYNILIQSFLHENIEKYVSKSLIRKITTQRSKVECIKMCCNNIKSFKVKYNDTRPIFVKEIKGDFDKFDELLGTDKVTKIQYIDKETSIDIIQLFKLVISFDRYFDLNDLYDRILNFRINDKSILIDYLYKEKQILNQL